MSGNLSRVLCCTQFTYFQQAGGRPLSVPAVEITYGLERILMALQVRAREALRFNAYDCVRSIDLRD